MRQKAILLTILPFSSALSLANFQQITSIFIPIGCQLAYDSQIPTCKVSDFQDECSSACQSALLLFASDISDACDGTSMNPKSLLGIVMNGGIVQSLCQTTAKTTTAPAPAPSTASAANSVVIPTTSPGVQVSTTESAAESVTIPTSSPGVQLSTMTTKSSKTTLSTTHTSATKTSRAQSTDITAASTTAQSTEFTESAQTTSTSTEKSSETSKTTTAAATTTTMNSQEVEAQGRGSGGGSPFDISSTGTRINEGSVLALVVAMWGCVMLGA